MNKVSAIFTWLVNNGYPTNDETLDLAKAMAEEENEVEDIDDEDMDSFDF